MLDGVKQWLLFRIVFDDTEKEKDFVKSVNGLSLQKLQELLKSMKVSYIIKTSKPGDAFFVPAGMYHAVENMDIGKGTIFVNIVHNGFNEILDKRFTQIWTSMAQKCENQIFY